MLKNKLPLLLNLIRWDRPAGWLLLLWPTLLALWLAHRGMPSWHALLVFIAGTIVMRSAGCCINDMADQQFDAAVKRTAQRPLVTQQVSRREAVLLAVLLLLVAFGLVLTTNLYVFIWCLPALLVTIVYPFSKRCFAMPQAVLGVAFSFGIPMAFSYVRHLDSWQWFGWQDFFIAAGGCSALILGLANLFWVLAYDTEYAMVDKDDDLKIGIKTSAITLGSYDVLGVMLFYWLSTGLFGWLLWQQFGVLWALTALSLASIQVYWHWSLVKTRHRQQCFQAFSQNHWLGFSWFICTVVALAVN